MQELVGVAAHLRHLLQLPAGLLLPEEVERGGDLHLAAVVEDEEDEEAKDEAGIKKEM